MTNNKQQTNDKKEQVTKDKQQTTSDKQQSTGDCRSNAAQEIRLGFANGLQQGKVNAMAAA